MIIARNETIEARLWILVEAGNALPSSGKIAATNTPVDHTVKRALPTRQAAPEPPKNDRPKESPNEATDKAPKANV